MIQIATNQPYRGRFAPTPSGPLHFGSLVAALGSYLDARAHNGRWLVRIEDVDLPRCRQGADQQILHTLELFGLDWDESVIWQSQRFSYYQEVLAGLAEQQQSYHCHCTRKQIKAAGGHDNLHCRHAITPESLQPPAIRFINSAPITEFQDRRLGKVQLPLNEAGQDFILFRRDQLPAYQLAVVVDDIEQQITQVVRGSDLLHATGWQQALYRSLGQPPPEYLHLPLVLDEHGNKLSKQNHAKPLNAENAQPLLREALHFLGLPLLPELQSASVEELLNWGIKQWRQQLTLS